MISKIKELIKKYKHIILYIIFGVLTTVVDFAVSFTMYGIVNHHIANVSAWIVAVVFAFFTNRIFVFESKRHGIISVTKEFFMFCGGRISSLMFQEGAFLLLVDILKISEYYVKIPVSFGVVIINYFLSRLVFDKRKNKGAEK